MVAFTAFSLAILAFSFFMLDFIADTGRIP
jgi:hypothetical protein